LAIRDNIHVFGNIASFSGGLILGNRIGQDTHTGDGSGFGGGKKAQETIKQSKSVNNMQKCIQGSNRFSLIHTKYIQPVFGRKVLQSLFKRITAEIKGIPAIPKIILTIMCR
jgi:hypothetical protein